MPPHCRVDRSLLFSLVCLTGIFKFQRHGGVPIAVLRPASAYPSWSLLTTSSDKGTLSLCNDPPPHSFSLAPNFPFRGSVFLGLVSRLPYLGTSCSLPQLPRTANDVLQPFAARDCPSCSPFYHVLSSSLHLPVVPRPLSPRLDPYSNSYHPGVIGCFLLPGLFLSGFGVLEFSLNDSQTRRLIQRRQLRSAHTHYFSPLLSPSLTAYLNRCPFHALVNSIYLSNPFSSCILATLTTDRIRLDA